MSSTAGDPGIFCGVNVIRVTAVFALAYVALAVWVSPVCAQSAPVNPPAVSGADRPGSPGNDQNTGTALSATAPARDSNTCDIYLPGGFLVPQNAKATLVSFHIDEDAHLSEVSVHASAGNSALDKAALTCVSSFKGWPPASILARPSDVTLVAAVYWDTARHTFGLMPSGQIDHCTNFPPLAVRLGEYGTTVVDFHIAPDGTVQQPTIKQTSGYAVLDKASLDCVATFRYLPALQNGQPVAIDRTLKIDWKAPQFPPGTVQLGVEEGLGIRLEGQLYRDSDSAEEKLKEIESRNPRPEVCVLPLGHEISLGTFQTMGRLSVILKAAGIPAIDFCRGMIQK